MFNGRGSSRFLHPLLRAGSWRLSQRSASGSEYRILHSSGEESAWGRGEEERRAKGQGMRRRRRTEGRDLKGRSSRACGWR